MVESVAKLIEFWVVEVELNCIRSAGSAKLIEGLTEDENGGKVLGS